jgi:hypothetical protein
VNKGVLLAVVLALVTGALLVIGTISPVPTAVYYAGGQTQNMLHEASTPEAAVQSLGAAIRLHNWARAYSSLANKSEFSEDEFEHDLTGTSLSLRTGATLDHVDVKPLHQSDSDAEMTMRMHWSTVLGPYEDTRDVHLVRIADRWAANWPLVKAPHVPPQVMAVNYLRWDVIYRGPEDEWGTEDVQGPRVRIVDMHPLNRAAGVVVMGELINDDIVPAWVSVRATLLGKNGSVIATSGSFDMIMHTLLPKQVTPFLIQFPDVDLSQVASIRMDPNSALVPASADPIIEVQNQQYNPAPDGALTGQISNQSGQVVNFAHVISTFYDRNGQLVWVGSEYVSRALLPQTPVDFHIPVPEDLAKKIGSERTVVSTFSTGSTV